MNWSTSCLDWADRLINGQSIIPPPIFPEKAEEALAVFKQLKIVDAPGSPTFGESCAQWVFDLVASIFGSYDESTHTRLITEWFILVPKKNSKSTVAAGVMMTALILNWRLSASYNILAPTIEIAGNSYNPARDMAQHDEELDSLMHVQTHIKTITNRDSKATLKVLAADPNTVGGTKAVGTLIDELHLFGKMSGAENMFREATGGLASRQEGFVVWLTTQSDEPPAGIFKQKLQYARDVRDGKIIDPGFVPIIFEHPPEMVARQDHMLLENLPLVNPNLGYSVDRNFLEREYRKAEFEGQSAMIAFMAKHGNVEIGLNLRSDRWPGADFWEDAGKGVTLEEILEKSYVITVGVDGGGLDDLLGLAVLGRDAEDPNIWRLWVRAWCHKIALERRKSESQRYRDFERDGDLVIVDEIGDDADQLCEIVQRCEESGSLERIGVDPAGIAEIVNKLKLLGFGEERMTGVAQSWRLNSAIKDTERKVAARELIHGSQPLMAWCVSNARIEPKGNAVLVTKAASGTGKIDPLIATFMAVGLMVLDPKPMSSFSKYEKEGLLTF